MAPNAGNWMSADQQAEDHADGQRQQVRGRARTRDAAEQFSGFFDGALEADNGEDVHPLQLGLQAHRERHAAALVVHDLQLAGERRFAERDELAVDDRLVGHKDFGLIERDIERLLVRDFRTDQAHLVGQAFDLAAERDHVAFLQHDRRIRSERVLASHHVDDAIFGMLLAELLDALAGRRGILQLVGPQSEGTEAREARRLRRCSRRILLHTSWRRPWHRCPTSAAGICRSG